MSPMDRRSFIKSAAAGAGLLVGGVAGPAQAASDYVNITRPARTLLGGQKPKSNINHVVVVMMENRSVDHYLGWWGETEGVTFDAKTTLDGRDPVDWGAGGDPGFAQHQNYTGKGFGDPNHSHTGGRYQILDTSGDGEPDGWDRPNTGTDAYALSYYTAADLPVLAQIVRDHTAFDRYFCSWMGNTYPNRYYMHSAQAHGIANNDFPPQRAAQNPEWTVGFDWPTLWDFLTLRGVTWKYYYSNLPVIALFGARNLANTRHISEYYADCAAGTLPQVAFVDPAFVADQGLANDDHPHADIRLGQEFYSDVTTAFMRSPNWRRGAMFITYDEWGGFWDHVTPPAVGTDVDPLSTFGPGASPDYRLLGPHTTAATPDFGLYGFRVPTFLLSPYARAGADGLGRTNSSLHDHTTILRFIAENWGLPDPGQWEPGFTRTPQSTMFDAFDASVLVEGDPGDPAVDVEAYEYEAPPEARISNSPIPASSVSALWGAADWIESQGYTIHTRFADGLPVTRR